jgi:hypothetical protein
MNILDIRRYEMLVRVKEFGVAHAEMFPTTSLGGSTFAVVATAVDALKTHLGAQASGRGAARERTASKVAARQFLRDMVEAISRTARAIGVDTPAVDDRFKLPRSQNDQRLIATARGFALDADPLADKFVSHNMPATFLTDLDNAIGAFEKIIVEHATTKENNAAAKQAIETALEAANAAVVRLDAIVTNRLGNDREALVMWRSARHVSRLGVSSGRATTSAPDPTPSPAPAPVPVTVPPTAAA